MASKVETAETETTNGMASVTLIVGNSYTFKGVQFKRGEPKSVTVALAEELDQIKIGSADTRSKTRLERDRFEIEWPEGYEGAASDDDEDETASSGAKRGTGKRVTRKKPSRSTR